MGDGRATVLQTDVLVVGGGLAGLTAALALASAGIKTVVAAPASGPDRRTTALLAGSVTALEALGVWETCRERAAPLAAIRIVDDRAGLFRAPEVAFAAKEIGREAFGYSVENEVLRAALAQRAAALATLSRIDEPVDAVAPGADFAHARFASGACVQARLIVAADGRHSLCRAAAGIGAQIWDYPQTALTCSFAHSRAHEGVSTEFHTAEGPFTLVPLPGARSSLVWVMAPDRAQQLAGADNGELSRMIERQSRSILGKVAVEGGRQTHPLAGMNAERLGQNRVALVGEAAHVLPPIGAQGFNLGLRDAVSIAQCVVDAFREKRDIGREAVLDRYEGLRGSDVASRTAAVDLLNRSLLTDFLPVQALRGLGLYALDRIGPLRRAVMREGLGPRRDEPRLMRGELL